MPNPIKYTAGTETLALKKGNFYIGTGDVGKGPSDSTGYYQGPSPVSGGYVIYLNKSGVPGNLSYHSAANDSQLISFTNNLSGTSFTSATQCLNYYATQTDKVCLNIDYPAVVTNGLVLNMDAGFTPSYSRSGTTWYDLSGNNNNCTLVNGPTYNTSQGGGIKFDAVDDYATIPDSNSLDLTELTISLWFNRGDILTLAAGDQQNFFVKGNTAAAGGDQMNYAVQLFGPTGGGRYVWQSPGIGFAALTPPSQVLFANQWYNLVFTHVSTNTPIAYLNGIKQTNWTATNPTNALVTNTWRATISGDVERNQAANFNGIMSIVQLYNRALSETEVLQNWNALKGRFGL
jgi:Concanavalin A-like lectin/glucanases superfamily